MLAPLFIDIIGAGGLGLPAAWGLLELWTYPSPLTVRIYDADTVQLSNLHRQTLYETSDIGRLKAPLLAERLNKRVTSSSIHFLGIAEALDESNIGRHLKKSALVLESTDSVPTKFLVNDFCTAAGIPFCYAGAVGYEGQLLFVDPRLPHCGCLRCLFREFSEADEACLGPTCRQAGVLGPVVGEIGFLQAELACSSLQGTLDLSRGSVLYRHERGKALSYVKREADCALHAKKIERRLDLRQLKCPSTFLYTKLAVEQLEQNEILAVEFGNSESAKNVSVSVLEEGYLLLSGPKALEEEVWELRIARGNA